MRFGNNGGADRLDSGPVVSSDEATDVYKPKGLGSTGKGGTDELSQDEAFRRHRNLGSNTTAKPSAKQEADLQAIRNEGDLIRKGEQNAPARNSPDQSEAADRTLTDKQAHDYAAKVIEAERKNEAQPLPDSFTQGDTEAVMKARHDIQHTEQARQLSNALGKAEQANKAQAAMALSTDDLKAIRRGETVTNGEWQYQQNAKDAAKIDVSKNDGGQSQSMTISEAEVKTAVMQKEAKAAVAQRFAEQQAPAKSALQERGDRMAIARGDQPTIVERLRSQGQGGSLTDKQGNKYSLDGDKLVKTTPEGKVGKIDADAAHAQQKAAMTAKPTAGQGKSALQERGDQREAASARAAEVAAQRKAETETQGQTR